MGTRAWYLLVWCAVAIAISPSVTQGIVITPADGSYDIWIREAAPFTAYQDDAMFVSTDLDSGQERKGVVQFNISSVAVPITSARLELSWRDEELITLLPCGWVNSAVWSGDVATLTYADYEAFIQPSEAAFQQLGSATLTVLGLPAGTYSVTNDASAADLAALNTIRTGDGIITMIFAAASGTRYFNDYSPYGGFKPVKLVLNEALPVPGDLDGDSDVDTTDYGIFKGHWLDAVTPGTAGDFNSSGKVTLIDFSLFVDYYEDFNGGGSSNALSPVPEPGALALLAAALPAALWMLKRRK